GGLAVGSLGRWVVGSLGSGLSSSSSSIRIPTTRRPDDPTTLPPSLHRQHQVDAGAAAEDLDADFVAGAFLLDQVGDQVALGHARGFAVDGDEQVAGLEAGLFGGGVGAVLADGLHLQ